MKELGDRERAFLGRRRVGRLATVDQAAMPHIVPVCFALGDRTLYSAVDEKPKRGRALKRLRNITENPNVSFLADHYEEDWSQLGWVMLEGRGEILRDGLEFETALDVLKQRYAQYAAMKLFPVIAIRITRVRSWGNLER